MTDAFELPLTLVQALAQRAAATPDRIARTTSRRSSDACTPG